MSAGMPFDFIQALSELRPLEGVEPERLAAIEDVQGELVRLAVKKLVAARANDAREFHHLSDRQEELNRRGMQLLGLWSPDDPVPRGE